MNPSQNDLRLDADETAETVDVSDLLGAGQAFPAHPDASTRDVLIDAHCNKIGGEVC